MFGFQFLSRTEACEPIINHFFKCMSLLFVSFQLPLALFGASGNYASALYIAAVKANALEKIESELLDLVQASKKASKFSQFTKDLSVPTETRVKAITEICAQAKFSDLTKNFLGMLLIDIWFMKIGNCSLENSTFGDQIFRKV